MKRVKILDTTLRDGEQSPGCFMSVRQKVEVAMILDQMKIDVIEAGFATSNNNDFLAISKISKKCHYAIISSLARCLKSDIDLAYQALKNTDRRRIHLFIATSDIHLKYKLKKSREEVLEIVRKSISYAKTMFSDIEFSLEDVTRTDYEFACRVIDVAIENGATTINLPDTVGIMLPEEFKKMINYLKKHSRLNEVDISVHCHDDLGVATANSIVGLTSGIQQIECTVNGIGERAGNAALEEIVAIIKEKEEVLNCYTLVNTKLIKILSDLVEKYTHSRIQRNKAIVGENAFLHEAGIHQQGIIACRKTYEFLDSKDYGVDREPLVIGIHSGKAAIINQMNIWSYDTDLYDVEMILARIKKYLEKHTTLPEKRFRKMIEKSLLK